MASAALSASSIDSVDDDQFYNNFPSSLAPILTLFGEQVELTFYTSTFWADDVLFDMAPAGIVTALGRSNAEGIRKLRGPVCRCVDLWALIIG